MSKGTPASKEAASDSEVRFEYGGEPITFKSVSRDDHILRDMRRRGSFYERDVLERLRQRLEKHPGGASIDVGAFIGTHSIYFAKFCGLQPVIAYEANPGTFPLLLDNIYINRLGERVIPINRALGASPGYGSVIPGDSTNQGHSSVAFTSDNKSENVHVCTLDDEIDALLSKNRSIALTKIDVEGAELEVLHGAKRTIRAHRPLLCIEVHNLQNLRKVLSLLRDDRYWIIDCLGYSPTYIIEATHAMFLRRYAVNLLWLIRAAIPTGSQRACVLARRYLRRVAQKFATGRWEAGQP